MIYSKANTVLNLRLRIILKFVKMDVSVPSTYSLFYAKYCGHSTDRIFPRSLARALTAPLTCLIHAQVTFEPSTECSPNYEKDYTRSFSSYETNYIILEI